MSSIRVLVVDDSAFARKVVREVLQRAGDIEVVDIARDGLEAIEKAHELKPDVITLDLVMPGADGIAVLQSLPKVGAPRVVVVSSSSAETDLGLAALDAGAVELVHKPTALATDQLYDLSEQLVNAVRIAAQARSPGPRPERPGVSLPVPAGTRRVDIVLIGTSTGGPQALTRLLPALPVDFPVPIAIVVHMPAGYTEALAQRLNSLCALTVLEAHEGLVLSPGVAVVARAGAHLGLRRGPLGLSTYLDYLTRPGQPHKPSVDALFKSAAEELGDRALGVVLTGMGDDGLIGSRALVEKGSRVIAEAESSAIVYGMPRAVNEAGLAEAAAPLEHMVELIVSRL